MNLYEFLDMVDDINMGLRRVNWNGRKRRYFFGIEIGMSHGHSEVVEDLTSTERNGISVGKQIRNIDENKSLHQKIVERFK